MSENLEYDYSSAELNHSHAVLLAPVISEIKRLKPAKIFDLGCGNGSTAIQLSEFTNVVGIDLSESGIRNANRAYPHLDLRVRSVYDDLAADYGTFPVVVSLEVVEHLYDPRKYVRRLFDLIDPGGVAIISTPYHGYIKNLVLAATGKMDNHFTALWDGGHIKFWSIRTLTQLLEEAGFEAPAFKRVGRVPQIAKSMIAVARKPS